MPPISRKRAFNAEFIWLILVIVISGSSLWYFQNRENNSKDPEGHPIVQEAPKSPLELRAEYKEKVRDAYNASLAERQAEFTCTEVVLVKETDKKYTGFARFSNGDRKGVELLVDDDGRMIWSAD